MRLHFSHIESMLKGSSVESAWIGWSPCVPFDMMEVRMHQHVSTLCVPYEECQRSQHCCRTAFPQREQMVYIHLHTIQSWRSDMDSAYTTCCDSMAAMIAISGVRAFFFQYHCWIVADETKHFCKSLKKEKLPFWPSMGRLRRWRKNTSQSPCSFVQWFDLTNAE